MNARHERMVKAETANGDNQARRMLEDQIARRGYHIASVHIASALDHLNLMASFIEHGELRPCAPFSVARTALENAAQASWLMDPDLDDDAQRKRAIGAQYADYEERRKAEDHLGELPAGQVPAEHRRNHYMTAAANYPDHMVTADNGSIRPAVPLPSFLDLCEQQAPAVPGGPSGGFLYRLLSAFSHGKQWSALASQIEVTETEIPGGAVAAMYADDGLLTHPYVTPTLTVIKALGGYWHHARLE